MPLAINRVITLLAPLAIVHNILFFYQILKFRSASGETVDNQLVAESTGQGVGKTFTERSIG